MWKLKQPDIAAPGVQVIAATSALDPSSQQGYTMLSGTSMATPHIAGIVALLRSLNPDWSPAAIRSALTTTGKLFSTLHEVKASFLIKFSSTI